MHKNFRSLVKIHRKSDREQHFANNRSQCIGLELMLLKKLGKKIISDTQKFKINVLTIDKDKHMFKHIEFLHISITLSSLFETLEINANDVKYTWSLLLISIVEYNENLL